MHNDFDGFSLHLLFDENDQDWVVHFTELPTVSAFGETPEQAIEELKIAWEGVQQSYLKRGEPIPIAPSKKSYSGQFNVRIDKRLHRALAVEASQAGVSLNALVAQKLAQTAHASVD
jgi:predicted HicB family RNase H-like nuclease